MNKSLKYGLSIVFSVIGLLLIIGSFLFGVYMYNKGMIKTKTDFIPFFVIAIIGLIIIIGIKPIRIQARMEAQSDEFGNRKRNYANMSAAERKQIDLALAAEDEEALSDTELRTMTKDGSKDPDEDLDNLIGLKDVKQKVRELEAQMELDDSEHHSAYHMCFLGNPGTGKTTIAKIMTGYLYKYKFIKNNKFISTDAGSLLASSNPTRRLNILLRKSHNKVLFIDEAYGLVYAGELGKELLSVLLNAMENDRESLTIILAGYKKEMKELFDLNSGLKSRINSYLFFENYSIFEMNAIINGMAERDDFTLSSDASNKIRMLISEQMEKPQFANARTARTIYEKAKSRHYYNLKTGVIDKSNENTIMYEDIIESTKEDEYFQE